MYCVKCGVQLADTEKKCPLCNTVVYHPDIAREDERELYPSNKMPKTDAGRAFICGAVLIFFMIPMIVTFFSDIQPDMKIDWFGYVAGALIIAYLTCVFPMWFKAPNPVILIPCDFVAVIVYLLYIDIITQGEWFWSFALPITLAVAMITCTLVVLLRYLKKGKLYVVGGFVIALGALMLLIEMLMDVTFGMHFIGWSLYALLPLALLGGLLIYLAINSVARERIERRTFF